MVLHDILKRSRLAMVEGAGVESIIHSSDVICTRRSQHSYNKEWCTRSTPRCYNVVGQGCRFKQGQAHFEREDPQLVLSHFPNG